MSLSRKYNGVGVMHRMSRVDSNYTLTAKDDPMSVPQLMMHTMVRMVVVIGCCNFYIFTQFHNSRSLCGM
jgi:hypothetical protein